MIIGCFLKNWLGDVVFASAAIRAIKMNYPSAKIICFAPERCVDILKSNPYIDQIVSFDEKGKERGLWAKIRFIFKIRKLKLDQIYVFHRSFTRALIAFFSGAKVRIGYNTKNRGFLFTKTFPEPSGRVHSVDYFLNLIKLSGLQIPSVGFYEFYFEKQDLDKVRDVLLKRGIHSGRLVAIHPGANWTPKRWPSSHFSDLAREIAKRYDIYVVVTGGMDDLLLSKKIIEDARDPRVISLAGELELRELGALFSLCSLMISSDSGPLHIAGGVGTNVIGIFGPTDPVLTGPRGRGKNIVVQHVPEGEAIPWYGKIFPKNWMEQISADQILQKIEQEKLLQ